MYGQQATQAYADVNLHSQISSASPHQLISMLFDGAHSAIIKALILMKKGNVAARGAAISKAITIIDSGLRASLDHEKGGEISRDLERLYDYMIRTLMQANLNNDDNALKQVDELLTRIADTWKAIAPH